MKKLIPLTIIILTILLLIGPVFGTTIPFAKKEFRGIWVITWEIFKDKNGRGMTSDKLKARIDEILTNIKSAKINSVLWQVRQGGTVYYPSKLEHWGKYTNYRSPGFDPLAYALAKAKELGLSFHAWLNAFEARDAHPMGLASRHPEWLGTDDKGKVMKNAMAISPGIAAARTHLADIVEELLSQYKLDGVHLDYIRWSEYPMGEVDVPQNNKPLYQYDQLHAAKDGVPTGFNDWNSWRREQVTKAVEEVKARIKKVRSETIFSVAAIGKFDWGFWNGLHIVHQDSAGWLNRGIVDQLMAMNYTAKTVERLEADLVGNCPEACWRDKIEEGLGRGGKFSVGIGSLMLRNGNIWDNHPDLVSVSRNLDWVSGFQFFSYGDWELKDYFIFAGNTFLHDQEY